MMSVEMARTAVGRTTIECCVRWCATICAGSDTAEMNTFIRQKTEDEVERENHKQKGQENM